MEQGIGAKETRLSGIPASSGVAQGKILILDRGEAPVPRYSIQENELEGELRRLEKAIGATRSQLLDIQQEAARKLGEKEAAIFEAHLLVLEDATLLGTVRKQLGMKLLNIESVYNHVANHYSDALAGLSDAYLSERAEDVRDVSRRVLMNLAGGEQRFISSIQEPCIVLAHDLTPSDTAMLPRDKVMGFVTYIGSKTSHSAIMARSMAIAAVVGLQDEEYKLESGTPAVLDGYRGLLILNPTPETLDAYGNEAFRHARIEEKLGHLRDTKAITTDQHHITLSANIEVLGDIPGVLTSGAEGIGLYRSEFLFTGRDAIPDEEEQYLAYLHAAQAVKPSHVILRTLDIGGDKLLSGRPSEELNPFLGVRAIRYCLAHEDLFRTQLRAMLRTTVEGNTKIMYPMVSGVDEVRQANRLLNEERAKLLSEGVAIPDKIEVGVMIEIPSAALTAEIIAREVDFFSIGTNDLIQYSIAIDRGNEQLAHLYQPTHPAILRLIDRVVKAGHAAGIWVGLCGEMSGEPVYVPLLVGLGLDELSTGAAQVPRIKKVIQSISRAEAQALAAELLQIDSSQEILGRLEELARERFPDILD